MGPERNTQLTRHAHCYARQGWNVRDFCSLRLISRKHISEDVRTVRARGVSVNRAVHVRLGRASDAHVCVDWFAWSVRCCAACAAAPHSSQKTRYV